MADQRIRIDGRDHQGSVVAAGVYMVRLEVGSTRTVHRMVKIR